jgi:hypothetical protein
MPIVAGQLEADERSLIDRELTVTHWDVAPGP